MKASNWAKLGATVVFGALLANGGVDVARAGLRVGRPVSVSLYAPTYVDGAISGSLADARSSPDGAQFLSVSVIAREGEATRLQLNGRDAKGLQGTCTSTDPAMVQVALGLADSGYIEAEFVGNRCTKLLIENASHLAPKQP